MGVGRIFSREAHGDFSKIFPGVAKSGEICFFPLETKKTTFFAEIFQIQEGLSPTSDANACSAVEIAWLAHNIRYRSNTCVIASTVAFRCL